jgi:hypothetical protein
MGLDKDFKKYLEAEFPAALRPAAPQNPAAVLVDGMVLLHRWSPRDGGDATATGLAAFLWRAASAHAGVASVLVFCFDRQDATPRPKDLEHKKRTACGTTFDGPAVAALLEKRDELPAPWRDALADRQVRALVVAALADRLEAMFARGGPRKLIIQGAAEAARSAVRAPDGSLRRAQCSASAAAGLLGEGEVAMVYWARRLAAHARGGDVVLLTVDTDLVALAAMHASPALWVELWSYSRSAGAPVTLAVNAGALASGVTQKLGISVRDFVCICATRGTDFVDRAVRGAPAWAPYVRACAAHLKATHTSLLPDEQCARLDAGVAIRMLRAAALGGRATVNVDQAFFQRLLWNMAYWQLAPQGRGGEVDPMCGKFGWRLDEHGAVRTTTLPLKGGLITI